MFNLENLRTGNFDNLQPWRVYELGEAATTTEGLRCPAGTEFWFEHAIVNLKSREALVHGSTPAGDPLVFATRGPVAPPAGPPVPAGGEASWLAARPEMFGRVSAILAGGCSMEDWGAARRDADQLHAAAMSLQHSQPEVARWLADRSLSFYRNWMAQATSGGEGTAMAYEVRRELADLRNLIASGKDNQK